MSENKQFNRFIYEINNGEVIITGFDKDFETDENFDGHVAIPNEIEGYTVTAIEKKAFWCCDSLKKITIPDGVIKISRGAFSCCYNLTNIILPDSITEIAEYAFHCCKSLANITIPRNVTEIGVCAFYGCKSLECILVNENNPCYTSDDGVLFNKDKSILIIYPEAKASKTYIVPDGVTKIGDSAFFDCSRLTSITIPHGVKSIGRCTFWNCINLTNIIIPESVTKIEEYEFSNCYSLTNITIPAAVTKIEKKHSLVAQIL